MKKPVVLIFVLCALVSCKSSKVNPDDLREEIMRVELEFTEMAQKEGISKAFLAFAAADAVRVSRGTAR